MLPAPAIPTITASISDSQIVRFTVSDTPKSKIRPFLLRSTVIVEAPKNPDAVAVDKRRLSLGSSMNSRRHFSPDSGAPAVGNESPIATTLDCDTFIQHSGTPLKQIDVTPIIPLRSKKSSRRMDLKPRVLTSRRPIPLSPTRFQTEEESPPPWRPPTPIGTGMAEEEAKLKLKQKFVSTRRAQELERTREIQRRKESLGVYGRSSTGHKREESQYSMDDGASVIIPLSRGGKKGSYALRHTRSSILPTRDTREKTEEFLQLGRGNPRPLALVNRKTPLQPPIHRYVSMQEMLQQSGYKDTKIDSPPTPPRHRRVPSSHGSPTPKSRTFDYEDLISTSPASCTVKPKSSLIDYLWALWQPQTNELSMQPKAEEESCPRSPQTAKEVIEAYILAHATDAEYPSPDSTNHSSFILNLSSDALSVRSTTSESSLLSRKGSRSSIPRLEKTPSMTILNKKKSKTSQPVVNQCIATLFCDSASKGKWSAMGLGGGMVLSDKTLRLGYPGLGLGLRKTVSTSALTVQTKPRAILGPRSQLSIRETKNFINSMPIEVAPSPLNLRMPITPPSTRQRFGDMFYDADGDDRILEYGEEGTESPELPKDYRLRRSLRSSFLEDEAFMDAPFGPSLPLTPPELIIDPPPELEFTPRPTQKGPGSDRASPWSSSGYTGSDGSDWGDTSICSSFTNNSVDVIGGGMPSFVTRKSNQTSLEARKKREIPLSDDECTSS